MYLNDIYTVTANLAGCTRDQCAVWVCLPQDCDRLSAARSILVGADITQTFPWLYRGTSLHRTSPG
jgi:hypothetical protein